jgi:hypothetical protein
MGNSEVRTGLRRNIPRLNSLEVRNFRAFRNLDVEHLGNVNLIVGKNSVGKSALLEAIRLYAAQGAPEVIQELLRDRDEWTPRRSSSIETSDTLIPVNSLFYGRQRLDQTRDSIRIGPMGLTDQSLTVAIDWGLNKKDERGRSIWEPIVRTGLDVLDNLSGEDASELEPRIVVQYGIEKRQHFALDRDWSRAYYRLQLEMPAGTMKPSFVPVTGLSIEEVVQRWEQISLTASKEFVIDALKIIVPDIEDLDITGRVPQAYAPVVQAKRMSASQSVPLRSLGEGMSRLFGLALALVTAQDSMFLIDEIDSGLHFSVQIEAWRLVFKIAGLLNIQVFATTHSWDCVDAFQRAAAENQQQDGVLIRLQREDDQIIPIIINEETLAIVTSRQVEVR